MPLNWKFTDKEVYDAIPDTTEEWNMTERIILATMSVDLGDIKEKNIDEWLFRIRFLVKVGVWYGDEPTVEDLQKRIGLHTNICDMTRSKWIKKRVAYIEREIQENVKREMVQYQRG